MGRACTSHYSSNDLLKAVTKVDVTVVIDGAQRNEAFHGSTAEQVSLLLSTDNDDELENVMNLEEDSNAIMGITDNGQF